LTGPARRRDVKRRPLGIARSRDVREATTAGDQVLEQQREARPARRRRGEVDLRRAHGQALRAVW
jgi:hypothetical protein